MTVRHLDMVVSLFLGLFGAWILVQSLSYGVMGPLGPEAGFFPLISGILITSLSCVNFFRSISLREQLKGFLSFRELVPIGVIVVISFTFLWGVQYVGIFAPLPPFLVLVSLCVQWRTNFKWVISITAGGLIFSILCYWVFAKGLNIPLPSGPWGF